MKVTIPANDLHEVLFAEGKNAKAYATPVLQAAGIEMLHVVLSTPPRMMITAEGSDGMYMDLGCIDLQSASGELLHTFERVQFSFRLPVGDFLSAVTAGAMIVITLLV